MEREGTRDREGNGKREKRNSICSYFRRNKDRSLVLYVYLGGALWIHIYGNPLSFVSYVARLSTLFRASSRLFLSFTFAKVRSWLNESKQKESRRWREFFSLSFAYFFNSIVCCISRVVKCKLLRAWGWFTANWFVNVVFTSLETPIFLPFLVLFLPSS